MKRLRKPVPPDKAVLELGARPICLALARGGIASSGVTLIAIIALCAGVLIVVLLAIAFVVPTEHQSIDKVSPTPSPQSRRQVTRRREQIPALSDAPARPAPPKARTTPAREPERRFIWRRKLSHLRAWRRRRAPGAGWVAAGVALSVAISYLIAHM